jgi:prepilin-type N-terminal cleavage/methylation domain-containing protein
MKAQTGKRRSDGGFTLIELLIVIVILAVLAGIVAFAVGSSTENATAAACSSDAKAFQSALEEYKALVGAYPGSPALQTGGGSQAVPSFGDDWPLSGPSLKPSNIFGLTGDPNSPGGTWTAPDGEVVGPLLRELPSRLNYQIVTDGNGEVFVFPGTALAGPNSVFNSSNEMDGPPHPTVDSVMFDGDTKFLNFEEDPSICADANVIGN